MITVLDPTVMLTSDGGGQVSAARRPVVGADRVARFLLGVAGRWQAGQPLVLTQVNGSPGFVVAAGRMAQLVWSLTVHLDRIVRVDIVMAPDKLARVVIPDGQ